MKIEVRRVISFLAIGLSSLALVLGFYKLLSLVLWTGGPPTIQYTLVTVFVSWLNYEANRFFTFGVDRRSVGSMGRFATVVVVATGMSSALFWFGNEVLRVPDTIVIIANSGIVAFFTFTSHRLFTFHERPWRFFQRRVGE